MTGFVDLALERAFVYREHAASEVVAIPSEMADREHEARYQMLEKLADYDDHLMEELLSDIEPPRDEIFADLARELADGLIVPVLMGSAERDNGVRRLLKALGTRFPMSRARRKRQGLEGAADDPVVQIVKTFHGGGRKAFAGARAARNSEGRRDSGQQRRQRGARLGIVFDARRQVDENSRRGCRRSGRDRAAGKGAYRRHAWPRPGRSSR